uniref:Integrase catalytic domain-containing protein n=1 Tax=Cyprinus carpio TaxID=7962 RepID=A0A8C1MEE9_CYPCA
MPKNQKEPLKPHELPELPWYKLGVDIFELKGRSFLLTVDYFSKYPEVQQIPDKAASTVIGKLKAIFGRHGKEIISDHVPFASAEVRQFAKNWGINWKYSSPGYPQSNGMAERSIKTIKLTLKKAEQAKMDPHLALLSLRNTPVMGLGYSPAELLMGRVLRSTLPIASVALKPKHPKDVQKKLVQQQQRQAHYYNQHAKPLSVIQPGSVVRVETSQGWKPAVVTEQRPEPRSYNIVTDSGQTYRRNRRHLRTIKDQDLTGVVEEVGGDDTEGTVQKDNVQDQTAVFENTEQGNRTRSGRLVKRPSRFSDFEMH